MFVNETFRPLDRVRVVEYDRVPRILVGELGLIRTMHRGRGRNRRKWYARVEFDRFVAIRTVPLSVLSRDLGIGR